ncbi:MAG: bifunctional diaminohydroxyphosphoribosylaminopyrimidine deaminase/5-amino-6-(5-phosphoribosylamino)uracil reductase RibD [Syntrophomonadaceae bacterium]
MQYSDDLKYMQRALELAIMARGRTRPNPVVGAVVVNAGEIVGEGYHKKAGTPHAEVHALQQAGLKANGATIYVTLEPCNHYGKTPPCTKAIIEAGIKKVVVATLDPNPRVCGQGIKALNEAGIETIIGIMEAEAQKINEAFFTRIIKGRPLVSLKVAMTLDGKIATCSGNSRWITGEESRNYVHELRNIYDVIMVGIGTVLLDDPLLNTRLEGVDSRDPIRAIVDSNLQIPLASQIVKSAKEQPTMIFCSKQADEQKEIKLTNLGLEIIRVNGEGDKLDLQEIVSIIGHKGYNSILLEGGAGLNTAMLEEHLIDKLYWFIAPKIVGGIKAPGPIGGQGVSIMDDAIKLDSMILSKFGQDIMITAYTRW